MTIFKGNKDNNTLKGFASNDTLLGYLGHDTLFGSDGDDKLIGDLGNDVLDGGDGNDWLIGDAGNDVLVGGSDNGNDILDGGNGVDQMSGGSGDDTYYVNSILDVVTELTNAGYDTVYSSTGLTLPDNVEKLFLTGNSGIDGVGNSLNNTMTGNGKANVLDGQDGDDWLDGGFGKDTLLGGLGDDTYVVGSSNDKTIEQLANGGTDTVRASVSWVLGANLENLELYAFNGSGSGNSLDNNISAYSGNNVLKGKAGNDVLNAQYGIDTLEGGTGKDNLKITDFNGDSIDGGNGQDTLSILGQHELLNLFVPTSQITNIETIKFVGGNTVLTLSAQSVLDMTGNGILDVNAVNTGSVYLDSNWQDEGVVDGAHRYTQAGATVNVDTDIAAVAGEIYNITDATSAAQASSQLTAGVDIIVVNFGGVQYNNTGIAGGTIDLSGFGLEDFIIISSQDGQLKERTNTTRSTGNIEAKTAVQLSVISSFLSTFSSFQRTTYRDNMSWKATGTSVNLHSSFAQTGGFGGGNSSGTLTIVGLPTGLNGDHVVFV